MVFGGVAEPAVGLHGAIRGEEPGFGGQVLGQVGLLSARLAVVDEHRGLADHQPRSAQLGVSLRQREGDALVLADRPVEDDAFVGVRDSLSQRCDADPQRLRCNEYPFGVEPPQQILEAAALVTDPVLLRHPHVVVGGLARRHRVAPHLGDGTRLHAGGVAVHEEQRHAVGGLGTLVEWRGAGEQQDPIGLQRLGGPHLAAVDDVVVAVTLGPGGDAGGVGPSVGLGDAERHVQRPVCDARQEPLLHGLAAVHHDRVHPEDRQVHRRRPVHARARRCHLFQHSSGVADPLPPTAVLLGDGDADPSPRRHLPVELPGKAVIGLARRPVVVVEAAAQPGHRLTYQGDVLIHERVHRGSPLRRRGASAPGRTISCGATQTTTGCICWRSLRRVRG